MARFFDVKVGSAVFTVRKFDAFEALAVFGDLQSRFLGPLTGVLQGSEASAVSALEKVSRDLDGTALVQLARQLIRFDHLSVSLDGEAASKLDEGKLNLVLGDEPLAGLSMLIEAIVKENFAGFLQQWAARIGLGPSPQTAGPLAYSPPNCSGKR